VAVAEIGVGNEVQEVVGARAADDAAGIEAERAPDRLAQRGRVAVGVVLQVFTDRVIGGDSPRARSERRFVRRQLEHAGDAGCLALARHVGIDREYARTRLRTLQDGHFTLRKSPTGGGAAARPRRGPSCRVPGLPPGAARLRRSPYRGWGGFRRGPRRARWPRP